MSDYPKLMRVEATICEACLKGEGSECHTPGCSLIRSRSPDLDWRDSVLLNDGYIEPLEDWLERRSKRVDAWQAAYGRIDIASRKTKEAGDG
ncbi:MAG: hypothetical protein ACPGXK_00105 [Phycisphaerae bacterium]